MTEGCHKFSKGDKKSGDFQFLMNHPIKLRFPDASLA